MINKNIKTFLITPPNVTKAALQAEKNKTILTEKDLKSFKIEKTKVLKLVSTSIQKVKSLTKNLILIY